MCEAVDIGIGHDDDLVVARPWRRRILPGPIPVPERRDQGADLGGGEHLVEARAALDVQDLAAQGAGSPCALRSRPCLADPPAESPSTMKISERAGIAFLAVGELAGEGRDVERAPCAGSSPGPWRAASPRRPRALDHLGGRCAWRRSDALSIHWPSRSLMTLLDHRADFRRDQLVLGLRGRTSDPATLTESTQVRPSRARHRRSSATFSFFRMPLSSAYLLILAGERTAENPRDAWPAVPAAEMLFGEAQHGPRGSCRSHFHRDFRPRCRRVPCGSPTGGVCSAVLAAVEIAPRRPSTPPS